MKTVEKIYPSRQVFDITQKTSRLFTDKGEESVNKYCVRFNLKKRFCNVCQKETLTIRTSNNCVCVYCNQSIAIGEQEKEITQDLSWYQHYQMTQQAGYNDLDIKGYGDIYRAKIPYDIQIGDIFNIYLGESTKNGCEWLGSIDKSLNKHLEYLENNKLFTSFQEDKQQFIFDWLSNNPKVNPNSVFENEAFINAFKDYLSEVKDEYQLSQSDIEAALGID